ncbi:HAD-IIA family hydrolase [Halosegnis sp.]|uniref:HAD-IIA family hydrolase n=1 Tax=Halosegnis sp. TaxID=2864959 RepID=UPI0035D4AD6B
MDFEGVVLDLDGTVYRGDTLLTGAREAIAWFRERGLGVAFVTNNPTRGAAGYVERLAAFGIDATAQSVLSAGTVTAEYLATHHPEAAIFVVGSDGLCEQMRAVGLRLTTDPDAAEVVITSHDYDFDYETLTQALWALETADVFYGTDPDRTYPGGDGRPYPGSGAITRSVAGVADRQPDRVLGKPSSVVADLVAERLAPLERCLVVGDGLDTDIALGEQAGATTVLVTSGRSDRADVANADVTPDHVVETLGDVPGLFE